MFKSNQYEHYKRGQRTCSHHSDHRKESVNAKQQTNLYSQTAFNRHLIIRERIFPMSYLLYDNPAPLNFVTVMLIAEQKGFVHCN